MGKILCATRGGEASYRTQDRAIALAKVRGDKLIFLYVADLTFLDMTAAPVVVDVEAHLVQMGQFLLTMAQERAQQQGLQVGTICREGAVRDQIKAVAREEAVTLVVLGETAGEEISAFVPETLRAFAEEITRDTGAEVLIVQEEP